ncbi:hypothetical protein sos41_23560 [Alphaproteobacteria bacterium SO-S41]|nr:hypothetical protein sos41_23560 [Alphaproteobacteria bacterium SO-S41]
MTNHLPARIALAFALALGGVTVAQAADTDEVTATPSVRAAAAAKAAANGETPAEEDSLGKKVGDYLSQVHGEVGVAVGTNDMHAVYGTAVLPLGDEGSLTLSFEKSRNAYYSPFYGSVFGPGPYYGYDAFPRRVR